ncbi:RNA-guided endonuclease InsQ/TnpB family protein [Halococcus thailandensis]|uniref:Transposase, IS605 OrfB family protein n=1 Tax=Halococcus thailandensis JCM 13552 TaxID=1227457 RepID=M0N405_9EURY|nr:RNA-guided endonuclease TnpB family protein [Halococcus thailandensis]EMA52278.1 transposase, IS605 OrfB family protein [Halococcus thailandensis JCM 13552]
MAKSTVTRTYRARVRNHSQVRDDLDSLGFAASKLWNVARYTVGRVWDACGQIPSTFDLQKYLKGHERYADLHSQSSQRVLAELGEAFTAWYGHRGNGNTKANPPGYRKNGDEHPRSTVTFKQKGFKHDAENDRIRLSKGSNLKDGWGDFILCEYDVIGPRGTTVENVQQVRAVYEHSVWRLHIVCKVPVEVAEPPGDRTAGVDLGICNVAAVSFGDESLLYPGGSLKEDDYYFAKERAKCDDSFSREARRLDQKRTDRRTHFFHTLSKEIVERCAERGVGTVFVGDLGGVREDENGEPVDWGKHGNLDLHGWAFDRFTTMLTYKAEMQGIAVETVSERDTSKTCSVCGTKADSQRVERGLYVCDECGLIANADTNGAENIRQKSTSESINAVDRSNGWLAQPVVRLFDKTRGGFLPREQATREP